MTQHQIALEYQRRHEHAHEAIAEMTEEIARLRACLEVFAEPKNWGRHRYMESVWAIWNGKDNPAALARKALDGKP